MGRYVFKDGVLKRVEDDPPPEEKPAPKKRATKKSKAQDLSVLTGNEEEADGKDEA